MAVEIAELSQPLLGEVTAEPQILQLLAEQNQGAGHALRVLRQSSKINPQPGLRPAWWYTGFLFMAPNIPEVRYEACWTEIDGLYSCGCAHATIAEAMRCMVPDGRSFVRAVEDGLTRSLDDVEMKEFMAELGKVSRR